MYIQRKKSRVVAEEEVNTAPEVMDLLFEAEDVAELVAEVTGQPVEATADENEVVFTVGEGEDAEEFTITPEGDEEVLESVRRNFRGKRNIKASRAAKAPAQKLAPAKKPVKK